MKAWDILGYAYEADLHCLDCARQRFGPDLNNPPDTTDSEGNPLEPLFASSVEQQEVCGDCLEYTASEYDRLREQYDNQQSEEE